MIFKEITPMKTSAYQNNGTLVKLFCRLLQIGVVRVRGVLRSRSLRGHQSTVQNTVITISKYVIKIQHIVNQCTGNVLKRFSLGGYYRYLDLWHFRYPQTTIYVLSYFFNLFGWKFVVGKKGG